MADPDAVFHIHKHVVQASHFRTYPAAALDENIPLLLEVKQYIPRDNTNPRLGDLTIIAAGGIGYPKELYEPLFADLVLALSKRHVRIRGLWIADSAAMGQSSLHNASNLGNEVSWWDHSRDLLHIINVFHGQMPRPLIGMGHSMGAAQMAYLATLHPSLFTSLVLIEPSIYSALPRSVSVGQAQGMLRRRDVWPNRTAAEASFRKSRYYQRWDSRVLDRHLRYGLCEIQDAKQVGAAQAGDKATPASTPVRTVCGKELEAGHIFRLNKQGVGVKGLKDMTLQDRALAPDIDPEAPYPAPIYAPAARQMFSLLPQLRPWVLYVIGAASGSSSSNIPRSRMETTGTGVGGSGSARLGTVSQCVIEKGEHTLPLDIHLTQVVDAAAAFLADEMTRWRASRQTAVRTQDGGGECPPKLDPALVFAIQNYETEVMRFSDPKL